MQFQTDPLRDMKIVLDGFYDLRQAVCRQRRGASTEIQAGHLLFLPILRPYHTDLLQQGIHITVAQFLFIDHLAVRAEIADLSAEGNMDIQAKPLTIAIRQAGIVCICKGKGLPGAGQPHSGQVSNDSHKPPQIYFRYVLSISSRIFGLPRNRSVYSATKK